jgi:penicillin-binding protein activator
MNHRRWILPLFTAITSVAVLFAGTTGCGTSKQVTRIDANTTTDLSGRWNDTDSREVSEVMIADCLNSPWMTEHMTRTGKKPAVIVGTVRNESLEHVPTGTFISDIERAFVNSGKVQVVATAAERIDLRGEKQDQWENASEDTVKKMGLERGADYMLSGVVQSIEDKEGGTKIVFYQTDLTLLDIGSNQKVWMGQKKIKKEIRTSGYGM